MTNTASASLKNSVVAELTLLSEEVVSMAEMSSWDHVVSLTFGWLDVSWLLDCPS